MNDPTAALMPTHREENQLKELFEELKTFLNPPRRNSKMPMVCRCSTFAISSTL
ncbi:hypothetical protein PC116_g19576 [Phytophthora cactorum]|nr:hypothetical protein PC116_g19576 [Phytophthora cactorum]